MKLAINVDWCKLPLVVEVSWLSGSDRGLASSRSPDRTQAAAVVPLGKALYPHCLVFRRRLKAVGPVYRRVTPCARKRTHLTSREE